MNVLTGTDLITTLEDNDVVYVLRHSAVDGNKDKRIAKQSIETQSKGWAAGEWTTITIATGAASAIGLGAVASFHGFKVDAIIGCGTDRYVCEMKFVYDSSTAKNYLINGQGTLTANINIRLAAESAGQFYWNIENDSGASMTVKYKITHQYPAI